MKKILLVLLLAISFVLFIPEKTQATTTSEINISDSFDDWYMYWSGVRYVVVSNSVQIQYDHLSVDLNCFIEGFDIDIESFVDGSRTHITIEDVVGHVSATIDLDYESIGVTERLYPTADDEIIDLDAYKNLYMRFSLTLNPLLTFSERSDVLFALNNYPEFIDFDINGSNEIIPFTTVANLPLTTGSPFDLDGDFGTATFTFVDNDFFAWIEYFGTHILEINDVVLPSADFLDNVTSCYYYTVGTERFLYFAYNEEESIVTSDTDLQSREWTSFSTWNLTTNEVITTNKVNVLTYIDEPEENMDVFAYMYLPSLVFDDILSVSLSFKYRYAEQFLPLEIFAITHTEWLTNSVILEKDAVAMAENMPDWVLDLYTVSAAASIAAIPIAAIPVIGPPLSLGLFLVGGIGITIATVGQIEYLITGGIEELILINYPSSLLVADIEDHFAILTGNESFTLTEGDPLYRLYLGNYNKIGTIDVEIDGDTFKYTEIVYVTEGVVTSIDRDFIDSSAIVNIDWVLAFPEETTPLRSAFLDVAMPIVSLGFVFIAFKSNAFSNPKLMIGLIVFFVLVMFGITSI